MRLSSVGPGRRYADHAVYPDQCCYFGSADLPARRMADRQDCEINRQLSRTDHHQHPLHRISDVHFSDSDRLLDWCPPDYDGACPFVFLQVALQFLYFFCRRSTCRPDAYLPVRFFFYIKKRGSASPYKPDTVIKSTPGFLRTGFFNGFFPRKAIKRRDDKIRQRSLFSGRTLRKKSPLSVHGTKN